MQKTKGTSQGPLWQFEPYNSYHTSFGSQIGSRIEHLNPADTRKPFASTRSLASHRSPEACVCSSCKCGITTQFELPSALFLVCQWSFSVIPFSDQFRASQSQKKTSLFSPLKLQLFQASQPLKDDRQNRFTRIPIRMTTPIVCLNAVSSSAVHDSL